MKYKCKCGWVYDPEKTGKEFSEESDDYKCPECGAGKSAFSPMKDVNEDDLLGRLDSFLLGEKSNKVFPIDTLKKVQKLTSQNDHNGSRILVTKTIKNRKMQSAYEGI
ncbi:MAG: rubredoxin, partial [Candidatus Peribacteraceae bacterium]|nr:rubredoxin [Candidatus Peribacteraceae bacterium]